MRMEAGPEKKKMLLANVPRWTALNEWPQCGKCLRVDGEYVTVKWYESKKGSRSWLEAKVHVGRGHIEMLPDKIHLDEVVFSGFQLTCTGRLPKIAITALEKYEKDNGMQFT